MPPTILVVIGDLDVGGTEHHLLRVLPALAREGFGPLVYTLTDRLSLAPRFRAAGVEVIAPPTASAPARSRGGVEIPPSSCSPP